MPRDACFIGASIIKMVLSLSFSGKLCLICCLVRENLGWKFSREFDKVGFGLKCTYSVDWFCEVDM